MVHAPGLTDIRSRIERPRRDLLSGSRGDALDALRLERGHAYVIDVDSSGRWLALRKDGLAGVAGCGPDQLLVAITGDHAARPVRAR